MKGRRGEGVAYTEINSKTLNGFNINNPGLGGTTPPGESDERTEKAHPESIIEKILLYAPHIETTVMINDYN